MLRRRTNRHTVRSASIGRRLFVLSFVWLAGLAVVSGVAAYGLWEVGAAQRVADEAATLSSLVGQTRSRAAALAAAERAYLNAPTPQAAEAIDGLVAAATETVAELNRAAKGLGLVGDGPVRLRAAVEEARGAVGRLKQVQKRLGYAGDDGATGTLTAAQAALRTELNKVSKSGQNPATVKVVQAFAQMGQAKAEYMLAADDVSKGSFDAAAGKFDRQVASADVDPAVKARLGTLSKAFFDAFAGYTETRGQRERAADKASLAFDNIEPPAAAVEAEAAERRAAALANLGQVQNTVALTVAATLAATLLAGLFASILIGRGITRPLATLREAMQALSRGEDAVVAGVDRGDEIGHMARAVAVFRENGLERIRLEAEAGRAVAAERDRQRRVEDAVRQFRSDIEALMASVAETTGRMRATAEDMSSTAEHSAGLADQAAGASDAASGKVSVVAAAAEELSASIGEIAGQVSRTTSIVSDANAAARASNEKVSGLAEAAAKVGEVVTLIQTIAEQTNLLALNATIEAARAGEAGRGFAVVASEVKSLATQTGRATEQIARQIADIQGATREAVVAIDAIAGIMDEVNRTTAAIAAAVEEQGAATAEISRTVLDASSDTRVVSGNVAGVKAAVGETRRAARIVEQASADVANRSSDLERTIDSFLADVAA